VIETLARVPWMFVLLGRLYSVLPLAPQDAHGVSFLVATIRSVPRQGPKFRT
jgi:hypothetical protein